MIDKPSRRRALEIYENGAVDLEPINPDDFPGDFEQLRKEIKARRYALFASLTDKILETVEAERGASPGNTFPVSPYRRSGQDGFEKLRMDALYTFINAAQSTEESADYKELEELAELRQELKIEYGYINPVGQLAAGGETAINTMLTLLKNLPSVVNYHRPNTALSPDKLAELARHSVGLPWNIAMISIDQMMALQATVTGNAQHEIWAKIDQTLDPAYFTVIVDENGIPSSVKFDALEHIVVPAGYRYMRENDPLIEPTKLADIPDHSSGTIGCPVTPLPRRMHKLWDWLIDDSLKAGLLS